MEKGGKEIMANLLGEKILKVSVEFKKNKEIDETFLEYYAKYVDEHFYIEKMEPTEIIHYLDEQLNDISTLSLVKQNKRIENISNHIKKEFIEKDLLKTPPSFDALHFLALTTLGRIKGS